MRQHFVRQSAGRLQSQRNRLSLDHIGADISQVSAPKRAQFAPNFGAELRDQRV